jgi:hypothetical protein
MNPNIVAWFTFSAVVIGAVVSVLRPDNTALPFSVPPATRATIALVLGALQACLMALVSGTPWTTAVSTALVSVIVGFGAHGAPHTPAPEPASASASKGSQAGFGSVRAMLATVVVGAIVVACSAFGPGVIAPVANFGKCIAGVAQSAALSFLDFVAEAVIACGGDALAVIDAILADDHPALAQYRDEALATKRDPVKLSALRANVEARVAARRASK